MTDSGIHVLLLTAGDVAVLDRVDDDVFDHQVRRDLAEAFLRDPRNLLAVAIQDGVVVGMASGLTYLHPDKPLQLFINELGVAERCRRRGLARRLMTLLMERGRALGCTEAWVATEVDNAAARAVYEALAGKEDDDLAVVYTWPLAGTDPSS
jgi:ribosomal protein S18 acetylase RimI-like enzyme